MEPRPQRPRTVGGQSQPPRGGAPAGQAAAAGAAPGGFPPEGADPTTFIAPSRTEYDYSPLDLAPPGQRRRQQIVAAAVGLLTLLLLGAVGVFGYLLLRDEPSGRSNLAASQTEVARDGATVAAQQTLVADSAAQETVAAGGAPASPDPSPPDEEPAASGDDGTQQATEQRVATGAGAGNDDEALTPEQLVELLPDQSVMPEGLTESTDNERSLEEVVGALGDSPEVQQNLEEWGWSGNVERTFSAPDPEALGGDATTLVLVSIHGFAGEDAAGEALTFYADALEAVGNEEGRAPRVGDGGTRLLSTVGEAGETIVSLYVQQGGVVYRIVGISPGGDPTSVVTDVAEQLIKRNA
jgi:hypothetical protein